MSSLFSKPSSFPGVHSQLMTLLILNEEIEAIRWEQTMSRHPIPNLPAFVPLSSALPFAKMDELSRCSLSALSRMLLLEVLAPSFSCIYKVSLSLSNSIRPTVMQIFSRIFHLKSTKTTTSVGLTSFSCQDPFVYSSEELPMVTLSACS